MKVDGHTIIITTPEDLLPLIVEALDLAGYGKSTRDNGDSRPKRRLLSPKDIEREYGINKRTLTYWRVEGMGPPFSNCGKLVYYERADLEKFLADTKIHTTGYVE